MNRRLLFLPILATILLMCDRQNPPDLHHLNAGLVVIDVETIDSARGWKTADYYMGQGLEADTANVSFTIPLKLSESGEYYVWFLGRPDMRNLDHGDFELTIGDQILQLNVDSSLSLEWKNEDSMGQRAKINLPGSGVIPLRVLARQKSLYLDRIILAQDPDFSPLGYGPLPTDSPEVDPIADKQEQEIILPPFWAFGVLYGAYTNQQETEKRVNTLIEGDYPIDAYWIDSWFWDYTRNGDGPGGYMSFEQDKKAYPNPEKMWKMMGDRGIRSGIWMWNTILKKENEEVYADFENRGFFKETYLNTDGWHNEGSNSMTGDVDFSNPEAVEYWKSKLKPYFDQGLDFMKIDRRSDIPFTKAAFEASQEMGKQTEGRGFVMAHVHSTYDPRFKLYPTKWTGDAKIAWTQPMYPNMFRYAMGAFKENVDMVSDPHQVAYEVPFMGHDAGGYNFFGETRVDEELYIRWTQFAAFSPIMMVFTTASNPTSNMPFKYSITAQRSFRKHTRLRHQLFPYIYTYALRTREAPRRRLIIGDHSKPGQYLFGENMLVAPVTQPGQETKEIWLPTGSEWIDFWSGEQQEGGVWIEQKLQLEHLPLFVKKGAIIPMKPYTQTLDREGRYDIELHYWASEEESRFTQFLDDGNSNEYLESGFAKVKYEAGAEDEIQTVTIYAAEGSFSKQPKVRNIQVYVHHLPGIKKVWVNGKEISAQNYRYRQGILNIDLGSVGYDSEIRIQLGR